MTRPKCSSKLRSLASPDVQPSWRFHIEGCDALVEPHVYDLRRMLGDSLGDWPAEGIATERRPHSLFVTALNPAAARWMSQQLPQIMRSVNRLAGRPVPVVTDALAVGAHLESHPTPDEDARPPLFVYRIGSLVVAGARDDWASWEEERLDEARAEALEDIVCREIARWLAVWSSGHGQGELASVEGMLRQLRAAGGFILLDEGRSMRITPARGPRGMARLDVRFASRWRLSGRMHIAGMRQQGYGRIQLMGTSNRSAAAPQQQLTQEG